jgi:hypothetical protein
MGNRDHGWIRLSIGERGKLLGPSWERIPGADPQPLGSGSGRPCEIHFPTKVRIFGVFSFPGVGTGAALAGRGTWESPGTDRGEALLGALFDVKNLMEVSGASAPRPPHRTDAGGGRAPLGAASSTAGGMPEGEESGIRPARPVPGAAPRGRGPTRREGRDGGGGGVDLGGGWKPRKDRASRGRPRPGTSRTHPWRKALKSATPLTAR